MPPETFLKRKMTPEMGLYKIDVIMYQQIKINLFVVQGHNITLTTLNVKFNLVCPIKNFFPRFEIPCYLRKCIIFMEFITMKHGNYQRCLDFSFFFSVNISYLWSFYRNHRKNFS